MATPALKGANIKSINMSKATKPKNGNGKPAPKVKSEVKSENAGATIGATKDGKAIKCEKDTSA